MARYERDYGRDYGGRGFGGGRSEGWNRSQMWRGGFPGDDMWSGEPESYGSEQYDRGFRNDQGYGGGMRGYQSGQSGYGEAGRGFGYPGRGNAGDAGYGGRDNYMEGWQDQHGGMVGGQTSGRQESANWNRPRASEIMTENPHVVTPDASISDVARKMRDLDVGIIPVVEDMESRRLKGVITDRDITIRAVADGMGQNARVSDCMTDRVRAVNKNDSIQDVMWVMRREQVRRVPVTDREGRLVGIIAQADLAVDYASDDRGRETEVGETLERISEPARPEGNRMNASSRTTRGSSDGTENAAPRSRGRKSPEGN